MSALLSVLGQGLGLFGGFGNYFASQDATDASLRMNSRNLEYQRETNELNRLQHEQDIKTAYDLQQRSMDFNTLEAQKVREWQLSPQRIQQMRDAGINPYAVLAGASPSVSASSSPAGVPAGAPAVAPHEQFDPTGYQMRGNAFAGLSRMFNDFVQNSKTEQESKLLAIESLTKLDENIARIESIRADTASKKKNTAYLDEQLYQLRKMRDDLIKQSGLQTQILEKQKTALDDEHLYKQSLVAYQELVNKNLPAEQQAALAESAARIAVDYSQFKLNLKQASVSIAQAALLAEQKKGVVITNKHLDEQLSAAVRYLNQQRRESRSVEYRNYREGSRIHVGMPFGTGGDMLDDGSVSDWLSNDEYMDAKQELRDSLNRPSSNSVPYKNKPDYHQPNQQLNSKYPMSFFGY